MSEADRKRWDEWYAPAGLVMGPELKPLVLELAGVLPTQGHALDIACGEGQLALWLAARGLQVTAVDISTVALAKLRDLAAARGLAARIDALEIDLDGGLPPLPGPLGLVTCIDFYSPALMAEARGRLAPGGLLLAQVLLQAPGGDSPRRAAAGEALGFTAGLELKFYREGTIGGRALAQLLAQKAPGRLLEFSDSGPACRPG